MALMAVRVAERQASKVVLITAAMGNRGRGMTAETLINVRVAVEAVRVSMVKTVAGTFTAGMAGMGLAGKTIIFMLAAEVAGVTTVAPFLVTVALAAVATAVG